MNVNPYLFLSRYSSYCLKTNETKMKSQNSFRFTAELLTFKKKVFILTAGYSSGITQITFPTKNNLPSSAFYKALLFRVKYLWYRMTLECIFRLRFGFNIGSNNHSIQSLKSKYILKLIVYQNNLYIFALLMEFDCKLHKLIAT